jgi:hypothetical protein
VAGITASADVVASGAIVFVNSEWLRKCETVAVNLGGKTRNTGYARSANNSGANIVTPNIFSATSQIKRIARFDDNAAALCCIGGAVAAQAVRVPREPQNFEIITAFGINFYGLIFETCRNVCY